MQALSPRLSIAAHSSPQSNTGSDMSGPRPALMKRQSSQSSHRALSPGSAGDPQPLRPHVKAGRKKLVQHARNAGGTSARNLTKLAQQQQQQQQQLPSQQQLHAVAAAAADEGSGPRGSRNKAQSRESDTEIRLPRSVEDQQQQQHHHHPQQLRRNFTATQLPRNSSHTKLKKNLSHGALTKLALNAPAALRAPPSPALKARSKRPRSADMAAKEKDLHEQEVELARQRQQQMQEKMDAPKKVGFAVVSSDEMSESEQLPQMDGPGLQEDEWTDQSASASPYSTRQNTANNSRRASVVVEKSQEKRALDNSTETQDYAAPNTKPGDQGLSTTTDETYTEGVESTTEDDEDDDTVENNEEDHVEDEMPPSPRTIRPVVRADEPAATQATEQPSAPKAQSQNLIRSTKEPANPATRHLLTRSSQGPAPALVSNVSALDVARNGRNSPAASITSSQSNAPPNGVADPEQEELVSRFVPSASHPVGSEGNATSLNSKNGSLHTPESESILAAQHRGKPSPGLGVSPVSPGSARSLSSSVHNPAFSRWRNEEKMMNEKVMAEMEDAAANLPLVPGHVYDRRNESLKSYLNIAFLGGDGRGGLSTGSGVSIGPELFQGRFKAVNTELKVVQRFRDPFTESIARLHQGKDRDFSALRGSKASAPPQQQKQSGTSIHISKSMTSLPKQPSKLSTSASPPKSASPVKPAMTGGKSSTQIRRGDSRRSNHKVTFSQASPQMREPEAPSQDADGRAADSIARQLWESVGA